MILLVSGPQCIYQYLSLLKKLPDAGSIIFALNVKLRWRDELLSGRYFYFFFFWLHLSACGILVP